MPGDCGFIQVSIAAIISPSWPTIRCLIILLNGGNLLCQRCRVWYCWCRNPALSRRDMKPGKPAPDQDDLLRARLVEMIDMRHELVKLEALIDRDIFEREWPVPYRSPCDTTTFGRWFVLPSACLCACHARPSWPAGRRTRTGSISAGRHSFNTVSRLTRPP